MTALLYFLVAVEAVSLSVQALLADREDPARHAFLAFCGSVALAYLGFALSLLPGLEDLRALYLLAGATVPATALWTLDRAFLRQQAVATGPMRAVFWGTAVVAPIGTLLHVVLYDTFRSLPAAAVGLFAAFGFGVVLQRLWQVQEITTLRVDRTRLRYLFAVVLAAIVFTLLEQLGRGLGPQVDPQALSLTSRGVALQGLLPPFSAVFAGIAVYFLYHSVVMSRLLDLNELASRLATLLLSAAALVLIDGLTFLWVDTFAVYPFHTTFQLFLASLLFLGAYDPLRHQIAWTANRFFNRRGTQLLDTLDQLRKQLPTVISTEALSTHLIEALHGSGRVPWCSVYLWDGRHDAFVCTAWRGAPEARPLRVVAAHPFTDRFTRGAPWYTRSGVERRAQHDPTQAEVLALMDAMNADITIPLVSGRTVLGWVHVRDESWSDGYSAEEILQLQDVATRAGVVLSNIHDFQALEEQKRLAALGAMAAGLAHEIRNPLAGVKGAAQYLQGEHLPEDARDMLQVILDETDRLNVVVTQFLDYARPFELRLELEHVNALVTHTATLLRAQGLPEGVTLREELSGEIPALRVDATRLGQVVLNLLQNGLQAMPRGGELTVTTRVAADRAGRRAVEIVVSDTGPGIPDEAIDQLFVPFFTTKEHGTGLGLPICRRIVDAHGGELDVHSTERGASFVVRLPLDELQTDEQAVA